jgi:CDP-diacylglycerol--glycerol-3-phosphate 3-phosphatidyltransferase
MMTTANKITLIRISLIPVFVLFAVYYGEGLQRGTGSEALRWAAVATFALAAASDGLDGWFARRFNQRTELGVVLDPIADKGLLLAGVLTLSFSHWRNALPVWFGILVVARDLAVLAGVVGVFILQGRVNLLPHWTGKMATALQMLSLVGVMLQPDWLLNPVFAWGARAREDGVCPLDILVVATGFFSLVSGFGYLREGMVQAHLLGHGEPVSAPGGREREKDRRW